MSESSYRSARVAVVGTVLSVSSLVDDGSLGIGVIETSSLSRYVPGA